MNLSPRPDRRGRPGVVRAAALTVLLMAATTLSTLAPTEDGPGAAARPATKDSAPQADAWSAQAPVGTATGAAAPGAAVGEVPAAGAANAAVDPDAPRAAVATMSFDEPIQGGLTARQAQAASARLIGSHTAPAVASAGPHWTPAMGRTALARARSWLGMPYSWAGGTAAGPSAGRCDTANGADLDCHIVGFDCSGLMMYAWGAYASLPHFAQTQRDAGAFRPTVTQLRAGDLVFFSGYLPDGIGHVAIYEGDGMVIEAPQSGSVVRRSALSELMATDGTYRGAVRPLTAPTPTLAAHGTPVPRRGATVTLRGTDLSGVTSLTVGTRTVREFARRTDTAITVAVPRAAAGQRSITVRATTSWGASSAPTTLTYAAGAPVTRTPVTGAPAPGMAPTSTPPSKTPTTSPAEPPTKSPTKPAPTKPAPTTSPTKPAPSATAPTKAVPSPVVPTGTASSGASAVPGA